MTASQVVAVLRVGDVTVFVRDWAARRFGYRISVHDRVLTAAGVDVEPPSAGKVTGVPRSDVKFVSRRIAKLRLSPAKHVFEAEHLRVNAIALLENLQFVVRDRGKVRL